LLCRGHLYCWLPAALGAPGREAELQVLEFGPVGYQVEFGDLAVCHV
jgi:hypothetical protein